MKIKAFVWKSDLNSIKQAYFEVEQIEDSKIFRTVDEVDGNDETLVHFFAEYKGTYFTIGEIPTFRIRNIKDGLCDYKTDESIKDRFLSGYPNYIVLKVIELSGDEMKPYLQKRKEHIDAVAEENKRRDDERKQRDQEQAERYEIEKNARLLKTEQLIKEDKLALAEDIIEFAKHKGIKIHPRTLGSIYKNNKGLEISQTSLRHFNKGTRRKTMIAYTEMVQYINENI